MIARVSESEGDLVLVARALVGAVPRTAVQDVLEQARPLPARTRPAASRLLRDTLATGCVREVMRRGGWRKDPAIQRGRVTCARTWERTPPLSLQFSALSAHLCRWLTTTALADGASKTDLPELAPSLADELLLYFAHDLLTPELLVPLQRQAATRASTLCRIAFPTASSPVPPIAPWLEAGGAVLVAALAPDLARHWVTRARRSRDQTPPEGAADAHDALAGAFLDACDALARRDLAYFILDAGCEILGGGDPPAVAARLTATLPRGATIAARTAARRVAGAPLRAMRRVAVWHDEHKLVRHFEDEYVVAQHLLARWEGFEAAFVRAEAVLRELDALDASVRD